MTPQERDHALSVFKKARRLGRDPLEAADEQGLMMTSARVWEIRSGMLWRLARQLENADVSAILTANGRTGNTALDAQRAIVAWIRKQARELEE